MKVLEPRAGQNNTAMLVGDWGVAMYEAGGRGGWHQGGDTGQLRLLLNYY
jgi:hypothetical protein